MGSIDQHPGRMAEPYLIQTVDKCIACSLLDKPAERYFRHAHQPGHLAQADRLI